MSEKTKNFLLTVLIVGLVSMTIAYASLTQILNINAGAKVIGKDASWDIHFDDLVGPNTTGYAEVEPGDEPDITGVTSLENLMVTLKAPGDSVSYELDIDNDGAIGAKIANNGVFISDPVNANYNGASAADEALVKANLYFTIKYKGTDTTPAAGDVIAAGAKRTIVITIGYSDTATDMPTNTVTVTGLNAHIDFEQQNS